MLAFAVYSVVAERIDEIHVIHQRVHDEESNNEATTSKLKLFPENKH